MNILRLEVTVDCEPSMTVGDTIDQLIHQFLNELGSERSGEHVHVAFQVHVAPLKDDK